MQTLTLENGKLPAIPENAIAVHVVGTEVRVYEPGDTVPALLTIPPAE